MTRRNRVRHRVAIGPPTLPFRLASSVVLRYVFVLSGRITIGARSFASRDGEAADGDLVDGNVGPGDALRVAGPAAVECGALAARTIVITVDIETAG
jgi:hypothetical protein